MWRGDLPLSAPAVMSEIPTLAISLVEALSVNEKNCTEKKGRHDVEKLEPS